MFRSGAGPAGSSRWRTRSRSLTDNQMFSVTFLGRELFFQALREFMQTMKPYLRSRAGGSECTAAPDPTFPDRKCVFQPFANLHFNPVGLSFGLEVRIHKSILRDFCFLWEIKELRDSCSDRRRRSSSVRPSTLDSRFCRSDPAAPLRLVGFFLVVLRLWGGGRVAFLNTYFLVLSRFS